MRVVRHIEHQGGLARNNLEAAGQLHQRQAAAHCLRGHWQALAQSRQRRQNTCGVEQLVGTAQRRIGQTAVTPGAARFGGVPAPLLLVANRLKIMACAPQVGANVTGMPEQAQRGQRVAHHHGTAWAHDAGLLKANRFAVRSEQLHVVKVYAGDDGAVRVNDVDCIQSSAQAHLQNHHIKAVVRQHIQNRQAGELKITQRHRLARLAPGGLHLGK